MTILFMSDVHGCTESLERLGQHIDRLRPDCLVLLGDALYHGPRNPLQAGYSPPAAVELLNAWRERIIAVRGNCDCEVDQMLLNFPIMADYAQLMVDGQRFFLTHGHLWCPQQPPPLSAGTVFAYGHSHLPHLERLSSRLVAFNPGSLSLPKGGNPASFGLYEQGRLSINNLRNGECMAAMDLRQGGNSPEIANSRSSH
jgi:putative phosphoesterase